MDSSVVLCSPRSIPWSNWNEWSYVREKLFSDDLREKTIGLEIIAMWKTRGRLPHAIESSASLIEIIINDNIGVTSYFNTNLRSNNEMRHLYGIAIIRAINGLVDPSQTGIYAESIYNIASKIGLSTWLVELRHESTHGTLPSLNILRSGVNELITWYNLNYWIPQYEYLKELSVICLPTDTTSIENVNVNQIFNRNLNPNQTISSTFLTSIFLPMFLQATILSKPSDDMNNWSKEITSMISDWWFKITELCELLPFFVHTIIFHILCTTLDVYELVNVNVKTNNSSSDECNFDLNVKQWTLLNCQLWIEKLLETNGKSYVSSSTATITSMNIIIEIEQQTLNEQLICYAKDMISSIMIRFTNIFNNNLQKSNIFMSENKDINIIKQLNQIYQTLIISYQLNEKTNDFNEMDTTNSNDLIELTNEIQFKTNKKRNYETIIESEHTENKIQSKNYFNNTNNNKNEWKKIKRMKDNSTKPIGLLFGCLQSNVDLYKIQQVS